jgi:hypothetical protein
MLGWNFVAYFAWPNGLVDPLERRHTVVEILFIAIFVVKRPLDGKEPLAWMLAEEVIQKIFVYQSARLHIPDERALTHRFRHCFAKRDLAFEPCVDSSQVHLFHTSNH